MIAIVDYGAGNLTSVRLAFETLGVPTEIVQSGKRIVAAERVVFPGVGAAGLAVRTLAERGLDRGLREIAGRGVPFLGICLGAQILLDWSEEDGGTPTLGLLPGTVQRFRPADRWTKVPHMGWNSVRFLRRHPLLEGIPDESEFYFVHGYYPCPSRLEDVVGETEYAGVRFASLFGWRNLVATQFHPEKSGRVGLRLLKNFAGWDGNEGCPSC